MTTIRIFVHARLGAALIAMLFAGSALASGQTEFLAYSFPASNPLFYGRWVRTSGKSCRR